jgi:hypothetical protein
MEVGRGASAHQVLHYSELPKIPLGCTENKLSPVLYRIIVLILDIEDGVMREMSLHHSDLILFMSLSLSSLVCPSKMAVYQSFPPVLINTTALGIEACTMTITRSGEQSPQQAHTRRTAMLHDLLLDIRHWF